MSPLWTKLLPGLFVRVDGLEVTESVSSSEEESPIRWSIYGLTVMGKDDEETPSYPTSPRAMASADRLYPIVIQRVGRRALVESL